MKAISLTQPWAWIILHLGKRVENRSRNIGNFRGPVALHASTSMRVHDWWKAYDFVARRFGGPLADTIPGRDDLVLGAIVGFAHVVNQCAPGALWQHHEPREWSEQSLWYMGAHAYLLDNVREVQPIPCLGALGFWRLPADIERRLAA